MGKQESISTRDYVLPQHEVKVPAFALGKYLVNQRTWAFVSTLPRQDRELASNPSMYKGDKLPVQCISWLDAIEFCKRYSEYKQAKYRLPTEAEWEYACRAGTTTNYFWGDTVPDKTINHSNKMGGPTPSGILPPNDFGLHDMQGNLYEWCQDHWHFNYRGAPTEGQAWTEVGEEKKTRVIRGGSWYSFISQCESSYRGAAIINTRSCIIGLRVARSIE